MSVRIMDRTVSHLLTNADGSPVKVKPYTQNVYLCTEMADLAKLPKEGVNGTLIVPDDSTDPDINRPCAVGSKALVRDNGVYILWPDNEWAEI